MTNERSEYDGDVVYEVWRSGRNVDVINYDRVSDHFYGGDSADIAASHEIRAQRQAEERRRDERMEMEQAEEEYYRRQAEAQQDLLQPNP
jgi:hypothetical protein